MIPTHESVMAGISNSHGTHKYEFGRTYESTGVHAVVNTTHLQFGHVIRACVMLHIWVSYVTRINVSFFGYVNEWMCRVSHIHICVHTHTRIHGWYDIKEEMCMTQNSYV